MSEANYHITKFFTENGLSIKTEKILINKPLYLGPSILELNKTMHELWYECEAEIWRKRKTVVYGSGLKLNHRKSQKVISFTEAFPEEFTEAVVCRCFSKKVFLKFFAIFSGKHLCWDLFLIKF